MNPAAEEVIRRIVDKAPPLNPRQRLHLAVLLRPDLPVGIQRTPTTRPNGAGEN